MANDPCEPAWSASPAGFPPETPFPERLRELLTWAERAPAARHPRPWRLEPIPEGVSLRADRARGLSPFDPEGRLMTLAAGAVVFNLRVAAAFYGLAACVTFLPDPRDADLLAEVRLSASEERDPDLFSLFPALVRRRAWRLAVEAEPLPDDVFFSLACAAGRGPVGVRWVTNTAERAAIAGLVADGDRLLFADPAFRFEVGARVHGRVREDRDAGAAEPSDGFLPVPDLFPGLSSWFLSGFDLGGLQAKRDFRVASEAPLLAVVHGEDTPCGWLSAGEEVERVLLSATRLGLVASFLNQPIEVRALRAALRSCLGLADWPLVLMRLGYASAGGRR